MKKALGEVNQLQRNADDMAVKLATGDVEDIHKAMIAMNKAKLAFDFTIQVRNKVIEAYQEIMRMQV
jgi:flagellar hook-basal body complex protein FliE